VYFQRLSETGTGTPRGTQANRKHFVPFKGLICPKITGTQRVARVLVLLALFCILYFKNVRLLEEVGFRHAVGSCTRCAETEEALGR